MSEVEIKIRFIGSKNKFPSQYLKWLTDLFEVSKLQGEKIPKMEIMVVDQYGIKFRTQVG